MNYKVVSVILAICLILGFGYVSNRKEYYENELVVQYDKGEEKGYDVGYSEGKSAGFVDGYEEGYLQGGDDAYTVGYDEGYQDCKDYYKIGKKSNNSGTTNTQADTNVIQITYVLNSSTYKFHRPSCSYLPTVNRLDTTMTRQEVINKGYSPCGHCNP